MTAMAKAYAQTVLVFVTKDGKKRMIVQVIKNNDIIFRMERFRNINFISFQSLLAGMNLIVTDKDSVMKIMFASAMSIGMKNRIVQVIISKYAWTWQFCRFERQNSLEKDSKYTF